jgi:hypothetical protein
MYLVGNSCVIMYHDIYHDIYIYPIWEKHCIASDMCVDPCPHQCCALSTLACVCPKMAIPKVAIAILHSNRKMMINHGIWGYPTSQYVQKKTLKKTIWLRRHRHLHFPGTSWIMQMPCQSCQSSSTPKDSKRTHSKMQLKSFVHARETSEKRKMVLLHIITALKCSFFYSQLTIIIYIWRSSYSSRWPDKCEQPLQGSLCSPTRWHPSAFRGCTGSKLGGFVSKRQVLQWYQVFSVKLLFKATLDGERH